MTSSTGRPSFFIVGAPKTGTTALSEYLRTHPQVFMCDPKEPNFFNRDFDYYGGKDPDDLDEYLALFAGAGPQHRAVGEASVWYLYSQIAAERIAAFAPEARIVAMVRNPIALASSLHTQLRYMLDEDVESFEAAWDLQEARHRGEAIPPRCRQPAFLQYAAVASVTEQLRRFETALGRDRLHVIVFDDFRSDTLDVYRATLDHIGVEDDGRDHFPPVNESKVHRSAAISSFTQRPPGLLLSAVESAKGILGIRRLGLLERIRRLNRETRKRDALSPEFAARLREAFAPEVRELSAWLGRDLTHWLQEDVR